MKNTNPKISVVMSVYNGEKHVAETIESILSQDFTEFEFIIINDCSTDSSLEILNSYAERDKRVKIINNIVNKKLPASLNIGIKASRGIYIARIDADDICLPHRLRTQFEFMESHSELSFIGSLVQCFYDESNVGSAYATTSAMEEIHFNFIDPSHSTELTTKLITEQTYKTTRICHSSLFGRTEAFKQILYREDVFAEDWDLYNRAINRGLLISKVPEVLVRYRIVNTGMCGQFNEQSKQDIRQKIAKLNNGILKDCLLSGSFKNASKFFWYHYCRFYLATFVLFLRKSFGVVVMKPLFRLMKWIYHFLSPNSLRYLYKVLSRLNKYRIFHKIPVFNRVLSVSMSVLTNNKNVNSAASEDVSPEKHINIGVWTIERKWAMGGLNTILKMIPTILSRNERVRIINYGLHSEDLKKDFLLFIKENFDLKDRNISELIEIISASTYRNCKTKFNKSDRFIAGFWEPAEDFIKFRELFHFENEEFVYMIQDYEPSMLYRWGSEFVRCKATLEDKGYYPIFNNSVFVSGYMKSLGIIDDWNDEQILRGEPCATQPLPACKMNANDIKLVFYSRPTVDKNIYEIKIEALKLFIDYIVDHKTDKLNGLEIVGIGESAEDVVHRGVTIKNHGKVDYRDYVSFLKRFNVGMSCIISPAFAYPCIEFPRAGIVTVVNKFENRDLSIFSSNIVSCDSNARSMFNSLVEASEKIGNTKQRYEQANFVLPGVSIEIATQTMLEVLQV